MITYRFDQQKDKIAFIDLTKIFLHAKSRNAHHKFLTKFPEYQQIIPTVSKISTTANTAELILGVKRVGLFARENNNNIKIGY